MQIGGKTKVRARPSQPQWVVQQSEGVNLFLKFITKEGVTTIDWIGDPNSATQFPSKYKAKERVRDIENVPDSRCFKELEWK